MSTDNSILREQLRQENRKKEKAQKSRLRQKENYFKSLSKKKKVPSEIPTKKELDSLWTEIIKRRANYKSEISGKSKKDGINLTAHHIVGKPNLRLRYELKNGICLDNGAEHIFGIHNKYNPAKVQEIHTKIIKHIGGDAYNWLLSMRNSKGKGDLKLIKLYLSEELAKLH